MLNHFIKDCLSLIAILILSSGLSYASEYEVELLDENNGFASSIIFSIVQDHNGFLWFGTGYSGIMRYDGKNVVRYQNIPNDPTSLPHNNAGNLTLDSKNNLWIGSWGGGVIKYNLTTQTFTQYQFDSDDPSTISSRKVQNIFEDKTGDLWLGTGAYGLNKFNPAEQNFTRYKYASMPDTIVSNGTAHGRIWDITQTSANTIWIGTNQGLNKFNKLTNTFTTFVPASNLEATGQKKIRRIVAGESNTLFVGTDDGVLSFDLRTQRFNRLDTHDLPSIGPIYSMIKTDFNQYWVSTNYGVYAFSEDDPTLKKVNLGVDDQCSQTLFQDRQGIIWLTCEGVGVYKVVRKDTFKLYTDPIAKSAYSLLAIDNDDILIGTADHGIYQWNPSTNDLSALAGNTGLVGQPEVRKMIKSNNGDIWFINIHGVFRVDKSGVRHQIRTPSNMQHLALFDSFKEITVDPTGTIWLGTAHGLFAYRDPQTGFEYVSIPEHQSKANTHITSLNYVANNELWIGTVDGLNLWNDQTRELKRFRVPSQTDEPVPEDNFIYTTFQDSHQRFWVSARTGLYLFNKTTGEFSIYSTYFSEFQNLGIRFMKEDDSGHLWLITPTGASRLNPQNGDFQHFDKADGLSGSRYFIDLVTQAPNGSIYLSSRDGIYYFDPISIPERQLDAKILITNFEVLGSPQEVHFNTTGKTDIDLDYDQNYLKFEFATLDFLHSRQIKYSYKLEGFDTAWISNGSNNTAVYTNLDGGDYLFRVRAEFKQGLWYQDELAINVHIATPFWLQWWMFVVYACLVLLAVYYYIRRQKQSVLNLERQVAEKTASIALKSNKLEAANKVKSQFLANMSHEIRTPLTTVIGQAEAIICRDINSADIYREVGVIHDNGLHLLALLNDILDLTKIEENKFELELQPQDLHELLHNIHRMFSIEAQSKGLSFHTNEQLPKPLFVNIDGLRIKQILINLCSNAIKFTHQGHIHFDIKIENNELIFIVSDTGIGMLEEQTKQVFDSFTQADASISRRFGGSGLGLSLSNELAKLMEGKITVESQLGRGSKFTFSMPVPSITQSEHLPNENSDYDFSTPEHLFSGTILLAEDHVDNRRLIARLLKKLGLTVLTAGDGLEAIELYSKHQPEAILLDIQMPKVDGIQAFRLLRELGCQAPIIALTANAMSHDVEHYLSLGFDGLLNKPLNRSELIATITKYFSSQTADIEDEASNALGSVDMSDLVIEFKTSLSQEYVQFSAYAESQDLEQMAAQAHRLIGAAQLFGFPALADIATKVENTIKDKDINRLDALVTELLKQLKQSFNK